VEKLNRRIEMETILVGEIGINHNGDLDLAKKMIDLAILGGCKYVKFQKRTIEDVYTKEELDKYRESPWGTTNRLQKEGLEFGKKEFDEINYYCNSKGIGWFASPWDVKSVDFLMQYKPDYIKVASAMVTNNDLMSKVYEATRGTKTNIIVATGMSTQDEIEDCLELLGGQVEHVLSCVSSYPTPMNEMNMAKIKTLQEEYGDHYKIGFSNHSSGIAFILQAQVMGAKMIEYHITTDRTMYGSDQSASIESAGVLKIKDFIEAFETGMGDGEIKVEESEVPVKEKLRK